MFAADDVGIRRWHILRIQPGHTTEVTLLLDRYLPITTHWHAHTVICPRDACPLCEYLPARGLYYLPVALNAAVWVLELGSQSSAHIEQHLKLLHGGMKAGQILRLSRRGRKSPVYGECVGLNASAKQVTMLALAARVMAIYKYPPPQPSETLETYERRIQMLAQSRAKMLVRDFGCQPRPVEA